MERVTKTQGWEKRLADYFYDTRADAFVWGERDCCTTTLESIEVMHGEILPDVAHEFFDYTDKKTAIVWMRDNGGLEDIVSRAMLYMGLDEHTNALCTKRGDVCLVKNGRKKLLGIMGLNGRVMCATKKGWLMTDIYTIQRSWGLA